MQTIRVESVPGAKIHARYTSQEPKAHKIERVSRTGASAEFRINYRNVWGRATTLVCSAATTALTVGLYVDWKLNHDPCADAPGCSPPPVDLLFVPLFVGTGIATLAATALFIDDATKGPTRVKISSAAPGWKPYYKEYSLPLNQGPIRLVPKYRYTLEEERPPPLIFPPVTTSSTSTGAVDRQQLEAPKRPMRTPVLPQPAGSSRSDRDGENDCRSCSIRTRRYA